MTQDGNLYAYAVDNAGDERFTARIKDLRTGELLPDAIENIFYGLAFSPDGSQLFYTVVDESWRPYQVRSHGLGTPVAEDEVLYQEDDVAMWTGFELSADRRSLVLSIGCAEYSETRYLSFDDPDAGLRTVISRDERILYEAEPFLLDGMEAILLTHNKDAVNSMVSLLDAAALSQPVRRAAVAHGGGARRRRPRQWRDAHQNASGPVRPEGHHRADPGDSPGRSGHAGATTRTGACLRRGAVHRQHGRFGL